jgi:branched-subunit amino acid transport protein
MRTLIAFAVGGAVTWVLRVAPIAMTSVTGGRLHLGRSLRHAAPSAFAALVALNVSQLSKGTTDLAGWPAIAATAVTLAVAMRTRHVLVTLLTGAAAATLVTVW